MTLLEALFDWAADPARTCDQLYMAELLVETSEETWDYRHRKVDNAWRARREAARRLRRLDPGYRAKLGRGRFERAAEFWAEVTRVGYRAWDDPPVRDLTALRFCPQLKSIDFATELTDLAPLAVLPMLESLSLRDATLEDVGALGALTALRDLGLQLEWPWPTGVEALARLPALRTISYRGNLLPWESVAELPAAEEVGLTAEHGCCLPLRDLRGLPVMPRLRKLRVDTAALAGIERYPTLVELEVHGPYSDLGPLSGLPAVRKLQLHGERYRDLAPLVRMPELRELVLEREHGLDLDPLIEAPRLRLVQAPHCKVLETELASVNAALGGVDDALFVCATPREPRPLRLIACEFFGEKFKSLPPPPEDDEYVRAERVRREQMEDDPLRGKAEARWFERELLAALGRKFTPGWGRFSVSAGEAYLFLYREREASQIPAIVEALREVIARARFPWKVVFVVQQPDENERAIQEMDAEADEDEFDAEQQREAWEESRRFQQEQKEFLERDHRRRLREQQGLAPEPAVAAPDEVEPDEGDDEDETDGGAEELELGLVDDERSFIAYFDGAIVWMHPDYAENVSYYFSQTPENWDELPGPPEGRPRLR